MKATTFSQEVADDICAKLSDGIPLRAICRTEGMPAWRTVYDWKYANDDFAAAIARAREEGFDAIAEECLDIADDAEHDTKMIGRDDQSREVADTEWISRSKLRIETRLKLLSKWDPKRYGDKVQTELTGAGGGPVSVLVNFAASPKEA